MDSSSVGTRPTNASTVSCPNCGQAVQSQMLQLDLGTGPEYACPVCETFFAAPQPPAPQPPAAGPKVSQSAAPKSKPRQSAVSQEKPPQSRVAQAARPKRPATVDSNDEEDSVFAADWEWGTLAAVVAPAPETETDQQSLRFWQRREFTSNLCSLAVHLLVMLILALIVIAPNSEPQLDVIVASRSAQGFDEVLLDNAADQPDAAGVMGVLENPAMQQAQAAAKREQPLTEAFDGLEHLPQVDGPGRRSRSGKQSGAAGQGSGDGDGSNETAGMGNAGWGFPAGTGFQGRRAGARSQLAALHGGSPASEAAVEAGLKWLIRHQQPDGSWSFHHTYANCDKYCQPEGAAACPTGATGLALLCFLGAGYTHQEGPYQEQLDRALQWLVREAHAGDLRFDSSREFAEGHTGMYAQGICGMALCEAYGMTKDERLKQPAIDVIRFIIKSQDSVGGGWRYEPHEPGDTSVVGWHVMALISARMAGLEVPDESKELAKKFLDSVYDKSSGMFGYLNRRRASMATTAIGDLCSLYLHSTLDRVAVTRAIEMLARLKPAQQNDYAIYYISQVLHRFGGEGWEEWNEQARDYLVARQRQDGHVIGSWDPRGPWGRSGGRLYSTCMNVLSLEVYYRHLPLYKEDSFEIVTKEQRDARKSAQRERRKAPRPNEAVEPPAPSPAEPMGEANPEAIAVASDQVPDHFIQDYPIADRWTAPIRMLFDDAARDTVVDANGRVKRQHPNGGFGLPLMNVGNQALVHTGGDYGWFRQGEPVHAAANGIVRLSVDPFVKVAREKGLKTPRRSKSFMDWGSMIVIEHRSTDGKYYTTLYAHLGLDRRVRTGDVVAAGQQIGTIGRKDAQVNGGYEPHLHFGVREGRIVAPGSGLFGMNLNQKALMVRLEQINAGFADPITVKLPPDAGEHLAVSLHGQVVDIERVDGKYQMPSWILWNLISPEAELVGYARSTSSWRDPALFLRGRGATVFPAIRFTPTWDPEPSVAANVMGKAAGKWEIDKWIRPPSAGTEVDSFRDKVVCLLCVQNSCEPSQVLAGPMLFDASRHFAGDDRVQLAMVQTTCTDFRQNSMANLSRRANSIPRHIAIGHTGGQKRRAAIMDAYGIQATPWTIIIDRRGIVRFSGCLVNANELIRMIEDQLDDSALPGA